MAMVMDKIHLTGLACADCAEKLERRLAELPGVQHVELNFAAATLAVEHHAVRDSILKTIHGAGYGVSAIGASSVPVDSSFFHTHQRLITTIASGLLLAVAWGCTGWHAPSLLTTLLFLTAILVGGYWTFLRGWAAMRVRQVDMNVLMTIAVTGAVCIGQWSEGGTVAFLYSLSNLLEYYTMERTRQSLRGLMELAPREALCRRDGVEQRIPVEELACGDLVIVRPGEKFPIDGTVVLGVSAVNQAPITGESALVEKQAGDRIFAGTINGHGALEVHVEALAENTTLAKIIHQVEEAQGRRAPVQAFVDRFAQYYTPSVLGLAVVLAIVPPFFTHDWGAWCYRALTLVVVACPCALIISTPVAIVAAIGTAARHGVLIKGGTSLEQAGRLSVIAFDKTGTLTGGRPEITDVLPLDGMAERELLALAGAVEVRSAHPLAEAVLCKIRSEDLPLSAAQACVELPGRGARALIDGRMCYVGNTRLFQEFGVETEGVLPLLQGLQQQGKTPMLVGTEQHLFGILAAADRLRPESRDMVRALHQAGIRRVVMLTGDHQAPAQRIAEELGVDDYRAELLPDGKVSAVQELLAYGGVAMVGDGINDAPALATATVGIAMGVAGTDTALETADIALMADDLTKLPYTIRLSHRTLAIIRQNITLALLIKAVALALIFPGWLTLWMAVLADMGASLLVTLNALRLLGERPDPHSH